MILFDLKMRKRSIVIFIFLEKKVFVRKFIAYGVSNVIVCRQWETLTLRMTSLPHWGADSLKHLHVQMLVYE